jgi:hypothetical protein
VTIERSQVKRKLSNMVRVTSGLRRDAEEKEPLGRPIL